MALLTPLSLEDARRVLSSEYGIELKLLTPLAAGSVNSNFLLESRDGVQFFARIYEEQGESGARFELELNEALARAGVPVARPVRKRDGGWVAWAAGKPFAVYERVEGEVLCQKRVTPAVARAVGVALARVHRADLGALEVPEGRFDIGGLLTRLERVEASGRAALVEAASRVRRLLVELEEKRAQDLPSGLVHGDLFRDNVLTRGDAIAALLDFESACRGPYAYDLMVTLLAWCYGDRLEPELAGALLSGYHAERPLSEKEKANLAVEGAFACVRFVTTRLTDFSLRVPEGVTPARDYGRFFARLEALEGGALEPLRAGLD